jgi:alkylation response protein AidB-like acyl-CoA dehydrogenase
MSEIAWGSGSRRGREVVDAARALIPRLRELAPAIESAGRLPDELVRELQRIGAFRMTMPMELGGPEADPITQIEVVEALSAGDGSTGWIVMIGSDGGFYAAQLADAAAREVYRDRDAITAGVFVPMGRAQRVPGGYRVSGRWAFGSASLHAHWFAAGCVVEGPGTGDAPMLRTVLVPASEVKIHETWLATGLAGSGSHDFEISDVFVPAERAVDVMHDAPRIARPLYQFPLMIIVNANGVPLGIARAAIDALVELAQAKVVPATGQKLAQQTLVQDAVGRAEALLGSARSYLFATVGELWEELERGRGPSLELRARLRLATLTAYRNSREVVQLMYEMGGGSALYRKSPLDRHFRDISTIAQHALVNARAYAEMGRAFLGLDPATPLI